MAETGANKLFESLFGKTSTTSGKSSSSFDFSELLSKYCNEQGAMYDYKPSSCRTEDEHEYDWKDAYLTIKDEFDSYRKRSESTKAAEKSNLTKEIIKGFLDVVDFALYTYKAKNQMGTYTKEDEMILDKLSTFLDKYDVHPMSDPTGKPFDHNLQEAVMMSKHVEGGHAPGSVSMVVSHGYMIGEEVLRYAKVAVVE